MKNQIKVICLDRWVRKTRCASCCTLCFPDDENVRAVMRDALRLVRENCPMREQLKDLPKFGNPDDVKKARS